MELCALLHFFLMKTQRIVGHIFFGYFLLISIATFVYTVSRVALPVPPWWLVDFNFGVVGPFQRYNDFNQEVIAEGLLDDGTWERIDIIPYMPVALPSERSFRLRLDFLSEKPAERTAGHRTIAETILAKERAQGHPYTSVRLVIEAWPVSTEGFEAMRKPPLIDSYQFMIVP